MNVRRTKLAQWIALQTAAAGPNNADEITEMRAYPVREPSSGRAYTVACLRTNRGWWGGARRNVSRVPISTKPARA